MFDIPHLFIIYALIFFLSAGLFFVITFHLLIKRNRTLLTKVHSDQSGNPYICLHRLIFPKNALCESLLFMTSATVQLLRISLLFTLYAFILNQAALSQITVGVIIALIFVLLLFFMVIAELIPRVWIQKKMHAAIVVSQAISSLYLILGLPLTYPLLQLLRFCSPKRTILPLSDMQLTSKERLFDFIHDGVEAGVLTDHDKKLLIAVLQFRNRVAREVMVPRVNLFCLPSDISIQDAAKLLEKEGYSRVPVYKNSIDTIIGVIMFKDILRCYMNVNKTQELAQLKEPIESLVKEVLYTPETKNIAHLLQEFRKKQVHMAIVVDEYGGTSGLVTIEDILEEIVGEIGDEYDKEPPLYVVHGNDSWMVDGRMNLIDLEEELNIRIPQEGEYDTIAGYIFFRLGAIPEKGTLIHQDDFDLEIIASNERSVEKVKITPYPEGKEAIRD